LSSGPAPIADVPAACAIPSATHSSAPAPSSPSACDPPPRYAAPRGPPASA
jgi:hypothetical protein